MYYIFKDKTVLVEQIGTGNVLVYADMQREQSRLLDQSNLRTGVVFVKLVV